MGTMDAGYSGLKKKVLEGYSELRIRVPIVETLSYYRMIQVFDKNRKMHEYVLSKYEFNDYLEHDGDRRAR